VSEDAERDSTPVRWPTRPVKVALCSGVLFRHDAISHSLRLKLDLLRRLRDEGRPVEVTAFVQATDEPAGDVVVCNDATDIGFQPGFLDADLYVFEFGIYYRLFDAIFLVADPERILAVYHNVTPLELVTDPAIKPVIERSYVQRNNLTHAGHVACVSELNRRDLLALGLDEDRLSVLHLPPGHEAAARARPAGARPVELLFVGRIVRAKGILDLLDAAARLHAGTDTPFHLTVIGSPAFSERSVLDALDAACHGGVEYLGAVPDDVIAEAMARADVLVMPSYHEGFCLPVLEAFQAGCRVIAYDAGNLPAMVDGHGQVVPTGDVEALAGAMAIAVAEVTAARSRGPDLVTTASGQLDGSAWRHRVGEHVGRFSRDAFEQRLLTLLAERERAASSSAMAGVGG
jgi:glycosyltransferase involved in cell wall biosynthesis